MKKEYQQSILDALLTQHTRVLETLEEDQVLAVECERSLRERFSADLIWNQFDRIVSEGHADSDRQVSTLFARANRKRHGKGIISIPPECPFERALPVRSAKKRRGKTRKRRKARPSQQRKRACKTPEMKIRRFRYLRTRIYKIKNVLK